MKPYLFQMLCKRLVFQKFAHLLEASSLDPVYDPTDTHRFAQQKLVLESIF